MIDKIQYNAVDDILIIEIDTEMIENVGKLIIAIEDVIEKETI